MLKLEHVHNVPKCLAKGMVRQKGCPEGNRTKDPKGAAIGQKC